MSKINFQWIFAESEKFEVLRHPLISPCFYCLNVSGTRDSSLSSNFRFTDALSTSRRMRRTKEIDECHKSLFVIKAPDGNGYCSIQSQSFGKHSLGKIQSRAGFKKSETFSRTAQSNFSALPRKQSFLRNFNRCSVSSSLHVRQKKRCSNQTRPSTEIDGQKAQNHQLFRLYQ